ncbi:hypothetical protein WB44_01760 [Synechococcus sp. WH 8020]|nr:hypothetical protein WB44_01760 [Synechococcus sp. WH 8020]
MLGGFQLTGTKYIAMTSSVLGLHFLTGFSAKAAGPLNREKRVVEQQQKKTNFAFFKDMDLTKL